MWLVVFKNTNGKYLQGPVVNNIASEIVLYCLLK